MPSASWPGCRASAKNALRLALHLLKAETEITASLAEALAKMRFEITYCRTCHSHFGCRAVHDLRQ